MAENDVSVLHMNENKVADCPLSVSDWMQYLNTYQRDFVDMAEHRDRQTTFIYSLFALLIVFSSFLIQIIKIIQEMPLVLQVIQLLLWAALYVILFHLLWVKIKHLKKLHVEVFGKVAREFKSLQFKIITGEFDKNPNLIRKEFAKIYLELGPEILAAYGTDADLESVK